MTWLVPMDSLGSLVSCDTSIFTLALNRARYDVLKKLVALKRFGDDDNDSQAVRGTSQGYPSLDWTDWRWRRTPGRTWCCQSNRWTLDTNPERGEETREERRWCVTVIWLFLSDIHLCKCELSHHWFMTRGVTTILISELYVSVSACFYDELPVTKHDCIWILERKKRNKNKQLVRKSKCCYGYNSPRGDFLEKPNTQL